MGIGSSIAATMKSVQEDMMEKQKAMQVEMQGVTLVPSLLSSLSSLLSRFPRCPPSLFCARVHESQLLAPHPCPVPRPRVRVLLCDIYYWVVCNMPSKPREQRRSSLLSSLLLSLALTVAPCREDAGQAA